MILKFFFFFIGVFLITANFVGQISDLTKHPITEKVITHKNSIYYYHKNEWKVELAKYKNIKINDLEQINKIFASSIYHFWNNDNFDKNQIYSFNENWIIFLFSHFENFLHNHNFISKLYLSNLERLQWENIMKKGIGYCSQISIALNGYLRSHNVKSKILAYDGHIVVLVNNNTIMDADKNVFIEDFKIDNVETMKIYNKYKNAGYSDNESNQMKEIYNTNFSTFDINEYYPKLFIFVGVTNFFKWLIPVILLFYSIKKKKRNEV